MEHKSEGFCRFCLKIFSGAGIGRHLSACKVREEKNERELKEGQRKYKIRSDYMPCLSLQRIDTSPVYDRLCPIHYQIAQGRSHQRVRNRGDTLIREVYPESHGEAVYSIYTPITNQIFDWISSICLYGRQKNKGTCR
jgi:hypothetical protein